MSQSLDLGNTGTILFNSLDVETLQLNGNTIWMKEISTDEHKIKILVPTYSPDGSSLKTIPLSLGGAFASGDVTTYTYDFTIDWGDGTIESYTNSTLPTNNNITHYYPATTQGNYSEYVVTLKGECGNITFTNIWNSGYFNSSETKENVCVYLRDIISINNTAVNLNGIFKSISFENGATITLPKFYAPNCTTAREMFAYTDNKVQSIFYKNCTLIIPDNCFTGLSSCTDFALCFSQGADYSDGTIVSTLKLVLGKNIFPDSTQSLLATFHRATIINKIPEDFLYNLENITNLYQCFRGCDNTGFTLPNRFMPKNMSNVTSIDLFMGVANNYGDDDITTIYALNSKFFGTMEDIWDRTDLNSSLTHNDAFIGASTLDNYNEIPSTWGGGGA